jgi:excisionase family DNA binding protein
MENPFELILKRLDDIELMLKNTSHTVIQTTSVTEILNLERAAEYISLSKSAIYKKTSERNIPHFKKGKKLYFKRSELDEWLTQNRIKTNSEIDQQANNYISRKGRFRF